MAITASEPQRERTTNVLLTVVAVLLLVLVVGLAGAGLMAARAYARLQRTLNPIVDSAAPDKGKAVASELKERQSTVARELGAKSSEADRSLDAIARRRAALETVSGGPMAKVDQMIHLMQLMSDQMMVMNRQIADLESATARAVKPLSAQGAPAQSGTGGSGKSTRPKRSKR